MEVVLGLIFPDNGGKGGEPPMGEVFSLVEAPGRGMGHKNVQESSIAQSRPVELRQKSQIFEVHISFCVLVDVAIIPVRSLQSSDDNVPVYQDSFVKVCASSEAIFPSRGVVIAMDKEERNVQGGDNEIKVMFGQVAAGDDTFYVVEFCLAGSAVN